MMRITHDQRRLLELCALRVDGEGVDWSLLAREAAQRGGLDRLYAGEIVERSGLVPAARRVLTRLGEGIDAACRWVDAELAAAASVNARLVTVLDEDYPLNLRLIHNLPPFLFVLGDGFTSGSGPVFNDLLSACIVGNREPSEQGRYEARDMARHFAKAGAVVVSSLTRGIDTEALRSALEHGGRTLVVIDCGISYVRLPDIEALIEETGASCTLVSQFWSTDLPTGWLLERTEVMSGIVQSTIVVESSDPLSALQPAGFALKEDKLLFALRRSFIENNWADYLHQDTIKVIESAAEVLEELRQQIEPEVFQSCPLCTVFEEHKDPPDVLLHQRFEHFRDPVCRICAEPLRDSKMCESSLCTDAYRSIDSIEAFLPILPTVP